MIAGAIPLDGAATVVKLDADGVVKLDGFLDAGLLRSVHKELEAVRAASGATGNPPPQRGPSLYPLSMLRHGRLAEISDISRVMLSPVLQFIRTRRVGRFSYVSDIIGIESMAEHKVVTQWHVDGTLSCIAKPGDARVKLFFYLNDVKHTNGAFSYVPRSHHLLDAIHRAMNQRAVEPTNIRDLSDLRALFEGGRLHLLPAELQSLAKEMLEAIPSDFAPPGPYSLDGPPGTLIIFDERGVHRGGDISEGRRSILRISLKRETLKNTSDVSRAVARKLARMVLPRRYASLM